MTAKDYANIQRMIDESLETLAEKISDDISALESDLTNEIQDQISPVANDLSHLENTVSDLQGSL